MTDRALPEIISALEELLTTEKTLLLAGKYDALAALAGDKEQLTGALDRMLLDGTVAQAPVWRRRLAAIVARAQENEQLLAAAKSGAAYARARLQEIVNRQRSVGVYAETGAKPLVPDAGVTRRKFA